MFSRLYNHIRKVLLLMFTVCCLVSLPEIYSHAYIKKSKIILNNILLFLLLIIIMSVCDGI